MIKKEWASCKNILVIRADNMGDVLMSSPAIRAVKESLECKITLLTSSAGSIITPYIDCIDEVIKVDFPWIKNDHEPSSIHRIIDQLQNLNFDAAIIFTVFSQNPLPAALIAYMAGIPLRLAYCRENPYHLLTDWVPDKEPYDIIKHQVQRDLDLVAAIGCHSSNTNMDLRMEHDSFIKATQKASGIVDISGGYIIVHPGVSEDKRKYPNTLWVDLVQQIQNQFNLTVLITGAISETSLCSDIAEESGANVFNCAGMFSIDEFIALIAGSSLVVSVNTGTVHIASAIAKPVIVLYADTNPQHTPWNTPSEVFMFPVKEEARSKNEVIQHLYKMKKAPVKMPDHNDILKAAKKLIEPHSILR